MKRGALTIIVGFMLTATLPNTVAYAGANRTFVATTGADTGTCPNTAPCRSFAYAITQTNAGGEIAVLGVAGYGAVTINKAISITNDAGEAGVTTSTNGDAITISAGPSDVVNLRGLTLVGGGVGTNGITFTSGAALNIQNTIIGGFTNNGIAILPSAGSLINVSDTVIFGNGANGVLVEPSATATNQMLFERVQALGNAGTGFLMFGSNSTGGALKGTAADCVASGNLIGFQAITGGVSETQPVFTLDNARAVNNGTGVTVAGQTATIFLKQSTISGNTADGYSILSGAVIDTYGNNGITDAVNSGTLTPVGLQ